MGEARSSSERKSLVVKTLIIAVLLLIAFLSSVIYIFAYPKTTVTLHDDETAAYKVLSQFKVKKYSRLGELAAHEKSGYTFLYWAYEDDSIFNPNAELDMDALSLYATYSRNSYTITYHIQVYNEDAEQEGYISNEPGYRTRTELFGETVRLPYGTVGDNENAALLPELKDRVGYHFAGWTTKVAEEEVMPATDVYNAGGDFVIPAGDVDLYAYWEKNEYEVVAHTGNEYQMEADGLTPKKDEHGNFIIRNNRVQEIKTLKYLDAISGVTTSINAALGEQDGLVVEGVNLEDYNEYDFMGWYLDENYTIPANAEYSAKVNVVDGVEIPYLEYVDDYGNVYTVDSVLSDEGKYQFHLYSKWERRSYTVTFNNNHSGSNGKLDPITIYKYDDHYGKFYYHTIDLKAVTTSKYLASNKGYQFFAWSTTAQSTDPECVTYYQWLQDPISYDANGSIIESDPYYDFFTYRHEISEDRTFYTLWSRIRSVTFYQKNGANRFNGASFVIEGIAKQWFKLPGSDYVLDKDTGATIANSWTVNDYQYFAGWRVGSGTTGEPILEKNTNGTDNKEYYWIFSSTTNTSVTVCAYWESIQYKIEYYLNDGTDAKLDDVYAAGGKKTYYAGAPARENYIFDGWSTEPYPDNTPKSAKTTYTSANSFVPRGSETTIKFYASWTMNFAISYDAGVADDSVSGPLPTGIQYSKKGSELKMSLSVGSGNALKRTGYTFKGWVLKRQDGSYNTDIIFKAGNSVIFNFAGIDVTKGNKQGACYISGLANNQYPFFMDETDVNFVKLYAYWEAKEYTITIHDTASGATIVKNVKYGQDFNFSDYITADYVGKKFIGISASDTGPIIYSPELGMVISGSDIIGDLEFFARYETREIYIKYMIHAEDAGVLEDVEHPAAYGYSGYGNKPVLYNDTLNLPTPPTYNANFRFTHWYYIVVGEDDSETRVPIYSDERLEYEGDTIVLWANYVEETFTLAFKFINPLDNTDIITIDKTLEGEPFLVTKGSGIPADYYAYITLLLSNYENDKDILEYTLDGLFNTYQGQTYKFVSGQIINAGNYPAIQSSNTLTFVTVWSANEVKFVYYSGEEANAEKNTSYHTGKTFESTDSILLEDVKFSSLNQGESVYRWYIKVEADGENQGKKLYLDKGAYLVGFKGDFASIADMRDYISWTMVNGRYVGTVKIYAETQQVFTIEYHRINKGSLEALETTTHIYDGVTNVVSLMSSVNALKDFGNGLVFNGWVIYSPTGKVATLGENGLISTGSLTLDPAIFTDYRVRCYADISYIVDYNYLALSDGIFSTVDLKAETITLIKDRELDYNDSSNYHIYHTIDSVVTLDADTLASYSSNGYEYYGYEIGGVVYPKNEIENGFTIEIDGSKINVLCYVTTTKTVTYTLGSITTEAFTTSELIGKDSVTYTYVLGYDNNRVIAERVFVDDSNYVDNKITAITIKTINVRKDGYLFNGWQQTKDGSVFADIYKADDVIYLSENITFVTCFTTPEANSIKGYIKYLDVGGQLLTQVEVWNGVPHTVISADGLGNYDDNVYLTVYSWNYNGVEYKIGEQFSVPLLINAGQVFEFTAIVREKYTIVFETFVDGTPEKIVTFADVENTLIGIPTLDDGIEFSHWRFELVDDEDGTSEIIRINHNDTIAFKKTDGIIPVKYSCTAMLGGYNLHIIPVREGIHIYTLEAVSLSELTIKLYAHPGSESEEIVVEYGKTFASARDLLSDSMLALETIDRGICAWTTDSSRTDIGLYTKEEAKNLVNNITKIRKNNLELYAVWQTKYTVTYAVEDTELEDNVKIGYKDIAPETKYYFEGETVEIDSNVVKAIYYKGFNTVYYDNGTYIVHAASGNDYYYVSGFIVSFAGSETTQTCMLEDGAGSFVMAGNNVTLTPIVKTITYRVDFMENATTTGDTVLKTIYTPNVNEIELSEHTAVRGNFKFLGWNTDPDAEEPLTDASSLTNANTTLYAVWASNIFVSFAYNNAELFKIPLNKQGKLAVDRVEYYLSIEESTIDNGYLQFVSLNGNDRTYNYGDTYMYLSQFTYKSKSYLTVDEICALDFTSSSVVSVVLEQVYTVNYMSSNPTDSEYTSELITSDYFTANGKIASSGIVDLVAASKPVDYTHDYYQTCGWVDSNENFYNFDDVFGEGVIAVLIMLTSETIVTLDLAWEAKGFELVLNYTATPYTTFTAYNTKEEVIANTTWTNIASTHVTDEQGNAVTTTSTVSLVYGSKFVVYFDNDVLENYLLIGWSTTLYPLGFTGDKDTTDILFRVRNNNTMMDYSSTAMFNNNFVGNGAVVNLYPVFMAIPTHIVHIDATNGKFTYSVANDETKKIGYMADLAITEGSSDYTSQEVPVYYYNTLTVIADKPNNDYFKFNSLTSTIGTVNGNSVVIEANDDCLCTSFDNCNAEVKISYVIKTITINAKLDYTRELKSASDTSNVAISANGSTVTLSYADNTKSIVVPANSELSAVTTISEYFKLSSIMSGTSTISIVNNKIDIMSLELDEHDVAELVFVLAPKSFKVTLELQGGTIGDITYTSNIFGNGVIVYNNAVFEVVYDAFITLPTPALTKFVFNNWSVNGTKMDAVEDYEVTSNLNIIAYFTQNSYYAEYNLAGSTTPTIVLFTGGANLVVGRDSENNLISDNTVIGYTHVGWTERKNSYVDDDAITTEKRDYVFTQVVKGEDITINYIYETTTLASIKVEYGKEFAMPKLADLTATDVTGMILYGFATLEAENAPGRKLFALGQKGIKFKEDLGYQIVDGSTPREITLYAVYYPKYTYTFVYGTDEYPTAINDEVYVISAINVVGDVNAGDLKYTLNSTIPTPPTVDEMFDGYYVSYEINFVTTTVMGPDGTTPLIVQAGEKIDLEDPKNHNYIANIKYTLTPKYTASSHSQEIKLYITNPSNTEEDLVVTYIDGSGETINGAYYPIRTLLSNKFFANKTPAYVYNKDLQTASTVTWTIASNGNTFTTQNASLVEYKLLGYRLTYKVGDQTYTKDITFANSDIGHSIAGGTDYELRPLWEDRYYVKYYDVDNQEIVSATEYYDKGTNLTVENIVDTNDNYDKTGFVFVGYAESENATINYVTDFYKFGQEFMIIDKDYDFYPAYSKVYTINFATNGATLGANGGDVDKINITKNETATTYVGGPLVNLEDYFAVEYTAEGYTFGGFTLVANAMANNLERDEIISEYTLNFDDLTSGDLYIYVAWARAKYTVIFKMIANYKNGVSADSVEYSVEYLHNQEVDFNDVGLQNKISNLEEKYFEFKNFSYSEDGENLTTVVVDGYLTICVNFYYTYTIVYDMGSATYKSDDVPRIPEGTVRGRVGSTVTGYSANDNLLYDGLSDLYWTADLSTKENFFGSSNLHEFTAEDLDYANNNYEITLYLVGSAAKYTVNLHYFKTLADIEASFNKMQSMEKVDYTQLNYSVMTINNVEHGSEIIEFTKGADGKVEYDENYVPVVKPSSPFNTQIATVFDGQSYIYEGKTYEIDDLYDLLYMYSINGYEGWGTVVVDNTTEMSISSEFNPYSYYIVKTYSGANAFVNDVYIVYNLRYFTATTTTYLVDEGATIVNNASLSYKALNGVATEFPVGDEIRLVENVNGNIRSTIKDMIVFTPTEGSAANNIGYNFIGVYSAEYDGEGNIIKFVELSANDWIKGASNTAYIRQDNLIYIFYSEKQVKVTVQVNSPDNDYDKLSLNVLLDYEDAEDRIELLPNGHDFVINALYGQLLEITNNSLMPYIISYMTMTMGGDTIKLEMDKLSYELTTNDGSELTELTFVIYFEIELVEVYFYTQTDSPFSGSDLLSGEIKSITYLDALGIEKFVDGEKVLLTYKYCKHDGLYYNYVAELPYGSTIIAISTQLNNYTVEKWILNDKTELTTLNVVVSDDCHLRAEFEANVINVEFYTSNIEGDNTARKLNGFTIENIQYGDTITLPYVFIEEELYVSRGWLIGNDIYNWGEEVSAIIQGNDQLENNILKIYASSINKYYLVFANETSGTSLVVPDKYKVKNELIVSEYTIQMPGSTTTYTYVNASDLNNISTEIKNISRATELICGYVKIPDELLYSGNLEFGGWATKQSTVVTHTYTFSNNHITNLTTHEIKLSMMNSGMVILNFHITNPINTTDANKDFKLSTTASETANFDIPHIQMIYNTDGHLSKFITPVASSTSAIVQWSSYFANDTDVNLLDNYEFHGWSIVRQGVLQTPSLEYANIEDVSALIYSYGSGNSRTRLNNNTLLESLETLLQNEYYDFYAVWEEKHTIVFNAENADYTNGFKLENKHAQGEVVALPNNIDKSSSVYYDLQYGTRKLMGWNDTSNDVTIEFEDCTSGIYTYVVPAINLTFTPMWEKGAIVLFNTNFTRWRNYFAETMAPNHSVNTSSILSLVGYPYLTDSAKESFEYVDHSTANVNGITYITSFREGNYWTKNENVPVYKYAPEVFAQDGIYSVYGSGNYFTLLGWFIDENSDGIYQAGIDELITKTNADGGIILTLTEDMVSSGVLTIYALWEPKNVEVRFYHSQTAAINASNALNADDKNIKRYTGVDSTTGETGYTVVYVPFGGKITSNTTYATTTTMYMFSGYNEFMKDPMKVYNMNVTSQERIFYRFNYWSQINRDENILNNSINEGVTVANVISNPIMEDLYLYPKFHDQYVVEFKSTLGGYINSNLTQYVIENENIQLATEVEKVMKLHLIDEAYYFDDEGEKVDLISSTSGLLIDSVKFNKDSFTINNNYVTIYLHVKLVLKAYLPNYDSNTITQLGEPKSLDVGVTYNPLSMFTLTGGVLAEYGNPDFAGWYYSSPDNVNYYTNTDSAPYKLNTDAAITRVAIMSDNTNGIMDYYLRLNNSDDLIKLEEFNGGLSVCLYAHLVTTTTIQIPTNAIDYAQLQYSDAVSEYYEISESSNTQKLMYYTAYNSPHAPEFSVDLKYGYTITDVTYLTSEFTDTFNANDNIDKEYIEEDDRFRAYILKSTFNDVVTDDGGNSSNNLKVLFEFKINEIKKCNKLVFNIAIEYIKFNINYVFNSKQGVIQYYKNSTFQGFETKDDGTLKEHGSLTLTDINNPLYVGSDQTTYSFVLNYTISTVGEITTVALSGVPYGSTLQFRLAPISYLDGTNIYGSLKYHFDSWSVSAKGLPSTDVDSVGEFGDVSQKYTPVLFDVNELVKEYTVTGTMEQNAISKIVYKFVVPTTIGSEWKGLVTALQQQDSVVESYDNTIGYTIAWSIDFANGIPSGFDNIKAGDDITTLLEVIGNKYNEQFNSRIASGTSINLSVLLNYMWFNGSWNTFPSDFNNKVCYLDSESTVGKNYLYFDESGEVRLYSKLSEAVLITTHSRVVDYINTTTEISVDRADVALNSVNTVDKSNLNDSIAHILVDSANEIAVKVPFNSVVEFEVKPDVASSSRSAYSIYNWSADTGSKDVALGLNETIQFNTKDNKDHFITNARIIYPEYKLKAKVVIDTYVVNFYNNNDALIKDASWEEPYRIGYDQELADAGYSQYALTLVGWRNSMIEVPDNQPPQESTKITLPLFDLDGKANQTHLNFRHSTDVVQGSFGQYKYLFSHWSLGSRNSNVHTGVLVNYTGGQYNTVNLYANYHANTAIVYTLLDINSNALVNNNSDIYYLPTVNDATGYYTDMFGNSYSDSLEITYAINWLKDNSNGGYTGGDLYVGIPTVSASSDASYINATCVTTLRAAKSNTHNTTTISSIECVQIYPAITYKVYIYNDGRSDREVNITTLGGVYSVNMTSNGYMKFNNIIFINGAQSSSPLIVPITDNSQQFAYWEVWGNSPTGVLDEPSVEYNITTSVAYMLKSTKIISAHYNIRVNFAEPIEEYGNLVVYTGNTTSLVGSMIDLQLFSSTPTKKYIAEIGLGIDSTEISNSKIYAVFEGFTFKIIDESESPTRVIYNGKFNTKDANISLDKIIWSVSFDDDSRRNVNLMGSTIGGKVAFDDKYGSALISVCVANDANIEFEGFVISNANSTVNSYYNSKVTFDAVYERISGGSTMFSNGVEENYLDPWGTRIYFVAFGSNATTSDSYISVSNSFNATDKQTLANNTFNYRWEYKRGGFNTYTELSSDPDDRVLVDGGTTGKLYIRLVCDWKEYYASFAVMNTYDPTVTRFASDNVSGFAISHGLNSTGGSVYCIEDNKIDSAMQFTLLYGDTIEYDSSIESFIITSTHCNNKTTLTIKVDPSCMSNLFSQGWFNFTDKNAAGRILLQPIENSFFYNSDYFGNYFSTSSADRTYNFAVWLEDRVNVQLIVDDQTAGVLHGHGSVDVTVSNIKNSVTYNGLSHGINAKTSYFNTNNHPDYIYTGLGVSTKLKINADDIDETTKHEFVNFSYDDKNESVNQGKTIVGANGAEVTIRLGAIAEDCYCGVSGVHIHVLYDAANTASTFYAIDTMNTIRDSVTTNLYGGYSVVKSGNEKIEILNFWNERVKTINIEQTGSSNDDDNSTLHPRNNYRIHTTVGQTVARGNININNGFMSFTSALTPIADTSALIGENVGRNYILGLVEYVYTVTLHLAVDVDSGSSHSIIPGFSEEYVKQIDYNGRQLSMILDNTKSFITVSGFEYEDNLGMFYDVSSADRMGMVLGAYSSSDELKESMLVKNNGKYTLLGMDLYDGVSMPTIIGENRYASSDYYMRDNSDGIGNLRMLPEQNGNTTYFDCPTKFIDDKYYLVLRLQERTESHISFQITLPYISDMDNMELKTNLVDGGVNDGYYVADSDSLPNQFKVNGGIKFNNGLLAVSEGEVRNYDEYLVTTREYSVKTSGNKLILNSNGYVEFIDTNLYEFKGWYIRENNGIDILTPGTNTIGGRTFDIWTPDTSTKITSGGFSLNYDVTIYLVMERKAITVTYDDGAWWKSNAKNVGNDFVNYDVNTMLRYDYLNGKFSGTAATYPGGLVAVIPLDLGGASVFDTPTNHNSLGRSPKRTTRILKSDSLTNDMIRSGVCISYADDDIVTRVNSMLTGSLIGIEVKASKFVHNSVAIVGGMSTGAVKTTFDVLLKDSNAWFFVGVPTGDATTNNSPRYYTTVELYDMPIDQPTGSSKYNAPVQIGTYNFKQDTIQLIQSLAITNPENPVDSISLYISKDTDYRLYDGLYSDIKGEILASSYSRISFTYNNPYDTRNYTTTIEKPILTGYTIVVGNNAPVEYKHSRINSIYDLDGLYNGLNLGDYSETVKIYPIWELINVYKITIVDSQSKITMPTTTYVLDGQSADFKQSGFSDVTINSTVSTSSFTTGTFKTLTSGNLVFSGFIDEEVDAAKKRYGTGTDEDFNNYGVLKVTENSTTSYSVVAGTHVNSSGLYSFTITPTANIKLVAVWLIRGYTINYAFVGGKPTNSDISATSLNCAKDVSYPNLLEGLPIKIAQGFDYTTLTGTPFDTNGNKTYNYSYNPTDIIVAREFKIEDGLVVSGYYENKTSTTTYNANNLISVSKLSGEGSKYTIYFKLEHNNQTNRHNKYADSNSMYINNIETVSNCDSGDHTYSGVRDWQCFYCASEEDETISEADYDIVMGKWQLSTGSGGYDKTQMCMVDLLCCNCLAVIEYHFEAHGEYFKEVEISPQTCTTAQKLMRRCERCGYSTEIYDGLDALGHNFNDPSPTEEFQNTITPDCSKVYVIKKCQNGTCTALDKKLRSPAYTHNNGERDAALAKITCGSVSSQCTITIGGKRCCYKFTNTKPHNFSRFERIKYNGADSFSSLTCDDDSWYVVPICSKCGEAMHKNFTKDNQQTVDWTGSWSNDYLKFRIVMYRESWNPYGGNSTTHSASGMADIMYETNRSKTVHDNKWGGTCKCGAQLSKEFSYHPSHWMDYFAASGGYSSPSFAIYDTITYGLYGSGLWYDVSNIPFIKDPVSGDEMVCPSQMSKYGWGIGGSDFIDHSYDGTRNEGKKFIYQLTNLSIDGNVLRNALESLFARELDYIWCFSGANEGWNDDTWWYGSSWSWETFMQYVPENTH